MWKSTCYRSLLFALLLLPGSASATGAMVIPMLDDWGLSGIALALVIVAAINKRRRK